MIKARVEAIGNLFDLILPPLPPQWRLCVDLTHIKRFGNLGNNQEGGEEGWE